MTGKGWVIFFVLLIAVVLFVTASFGWYPDDLREDAEPVALGLAFLGVAFGLHLFVRGGELTPQ